MAFFDTRTSVMLVSRNPDTLKYLSSKYLLGFNEIEVLGSVSSYEEAFEEINQQRRIEVVLFDLLGSSDITNCLRAAEKIHSLRSYCKIVVLYDGKPMHWFQDARKSHIDGIWNPQCSHIGLERLIGWVMKDEVVYAGEDAFFDE